MLTYPLFLFLAAAVFLLLTRHKRAPNPDYIKPGWGGFDGRIGRFDYLKRVAGLYMLGYITVGIVLLFSLFLPVSAAQALAMGVLLFAPSQRFPNLYGDPPLITA